MCAKGVKTRSEEVVKCGAKNTAKLRNNKKKNSCFWGSHQGDILVVKSLNFSRNCLLFECFQA
jgi:hypothetical protein